MDALPDDALLPPIGLSYNEMERSDAESYISDEQYADCFEDEDDLMDCSHDCNIGYMSLASTTSSCGDDDQSNDTGNWTNESESDSSFDINDYDDEAETRSTIENHFVEQKRHWWKRVFNRTVASIERNDEVLEDLDDWLGEANSHSWKWNNPDLVLLGISLIGNTNLKRLRIKLGRRDNEDDVVIAGLLGGGGWDDEEEEAAQEVEEGEGEDGVQQDNVNAELVGAGVEEEEQVDEAEAGAPVEVGVPQLGEEEDLEEGEPVQDLAAQQLAAWEPRWRAMEAEGRNGEEEQLDNKEDFAEGARALANGIAHSQLESLVLVGGCGPFKRLLLKEGEITWPFENSPTLTSIAEQPVHRWTRLTKLFLEDFRLERTDMQSMCACLGANTWLTSLSLKKCRVTDEGIEHFCQHWNDRSLLESLILPRNWITSEGVECLLVASALHPALKQLVLSENWGIGWDGLRVVGEQLPHISLQDLEISNIAVRAANRDVRARTMTAFSDGLRGNTALLSLMVGKNFIGPTGAHMLMEAVAEHPSMVCLSLDGDRTIGLNGLKLIGQELPHLHLQTLDLRGTLPNPLPRTQTPKLKREALQAILDGVSNNVHLGKIHLPQPCFTSSESNHVDFYTFLNDFRPLLTSDAMSSAVWSHVFAHTPPSYIYFSLLELPWLVNHCG